MNNSYNPRQSEGLHLDDLDHFRDLFWEDDITGRNNRSFNRRQKPVNLTAVIDDYFRSH